MFAIAGDLGLTGTTSQQFVAGGLAVFAGLWAWYENKGHQQIVDLLKKTTNASTLPVAKSIASGASGVRIVAIPLLFAALVYSGDAKAQTTMPVKAPPAATAATSVCTVTSCPNMFFIGAGLGGIGNSVDIIGAGIDNSVFADGMLPFAEAEWLNWNGQTLLGVKAGGGYQFAQDASIGAANSSQSGMLGWVMFEAGGNISTLFGNPSSVTVLGALQQDLMTLYAQAGPVFVKNGGTIPGLGAGAKYCISGNGDCHLQLDLSYVYANDQADTTKNVQIVTAGMKFGW